MQQPGYTSFVFMCIYIYIHEYIYILVYINTHIHTYIHAHTHTLVCVYSRPLFIIFHFIPKSLLENLKLTLRCPPHTTFVYLSRVITNFPLTCLNATIHSFHFRYETCLLPVLIVYFSLLSEATKLRAMRWVVDVACLRIAERTKKFWISWCALESRN